MPKRLTHAMDEFGVRVAILVINLVMPVSGSHFLRGSTDTFFQFVYLFQDFLHDIVLSETTSVSVLLFS